MVVSQPDESAVYCINPDCPRPYPQPWGNKFCNSCGAPLQLKDRYVPLQSLGSGGFAKIYTVWDLEAQTEKVLKVLVEVSPKALELFEQEAAVLSSLRHPGVPRVEAEGYFQIHLDSPQPRQLPCLVMEKINGYTLEEIRSKHPQGCPQEWVLNWLTQAADILEELHSRKIIHRDIKPSNLMLREGMGQLVLIDFGGAKQFGPVLSHSQASSTRLFSSGYSPPEQVAGSSVSPATDLYALGRTMIELLTGKYPPELEDPQTGELRWRNAANVNPTLADLLDDLVQEDVRSRPANAAIIPTRLVSSPNSPAQPSFLSDLPRIVLHWSGIALGKLGKGLAALFTAIGKTALFLLKVVFEAVKACWDTLWSMVLTAIGAAIGTTLGFFLAYRSYLGVRVAEIVSQKLPALIPGIEITVGSEIILFAAAGLGTAWGLTAARGFGQRRRYLLASLMGILGYACGWFVWQITTPLEGGEGLVGFIAVALALLTLGLGLRSHHIVQAVIASFGTAIVFAALMSLGLLAPNLLHFYSFPGWEELLNSIAFFSFAGAVLSFFLGISYYIIVPGLRFLGWR